MKIEHTEPVGKANTNSAARLLDKPFFHVLSTVINLKLKMYIAASLCSDVCDDQ